MNGGHAFGKQRFGNLECMCRALKEETINWPFAFKLNVWLLFKPNKETILKGHGEWALLKDSVAKQYKS